MVSGEEVWLWFKHVWWYTGKYAIQMYLQIHLWKISDHMITNALWKYSDLLLCRNSCGVRSDTRRYIHEQDGAQAIQVPNCTTGNCSSHKIKALLNGNAIYVKLLSQFIGYSSAGKQSKPGRRPCGQQDSGRPQFWLVHVNCSFLNVEYGHISMQDYWEYWCPTVGAGCRGRSRRLLLPGAQIFWTCYPVKYSVSAFSSIHTSYRYLWRNVDKVSRKDVFSFWARLNTKECPQIQLWLLASR